MNVTTIGLDLAKSVFQNNWHRPAKPLLLAAQSGGATCAGLPNPGVGATCAYTRSAEEEFLQWAIAR
jgi:hypothetical protein